MVTTVVISLRIDVWLILSSTILTRLFDLFAFNGKHYAAHYTNQKAYRAHKDGQEEEDRLFYVK